MKYANLDYPIYVLKKWVADMVKVFPTNHNNKDKRSVSDYTYMTDEMLRRIKAMQLAIKKLEKENSYLLIEVDEEIKIELYERNK